MLVKGKEMREVQVEVYPCEMLLALISRYGHAAKNLLEMNRDTESKLVMHDDKYFIEYYEGVSYHGNSSLNKKEWELSEEAYKAIQCIKYLYDLEMKK